MAYRRLQGREAVRLRLPAPVRVLDRDVPLDLVRVRVRERLPRRFVLRRTAMLGFTFRGSRVSEFLSARVKKALLAYCSLIFVVVRDRACELWRV